MSGPEAKRIHVSRSPWGPVESVKYLESTGVEQTADTKYWRADTRSRCGGVYFADSFAVVLANGDGVVWAKMTCGYGSSSDNVPNQWKQLVKFVATQS